MKVISIDPGKKGSIAIIDENENILHLWMIPLIKKDYDILEITKIFQFAKDKYGDELVGGLEKCLLVAISGIKSVASTHLINGVFQGILATLKIPYQVIHPKIWQRKIFEGLNYRDKKEASILFCKRKYPETDFRATERSRNDSDGKTDAVCIGLFILRNR